MSVSTELAELEASRAKYIKARDKISTGQSYSMGSVNLTRADLGAVEEILAKLNRQITEARVILGAPADSFAAAQPGVSVARVR